MRRINLPAVPFARENWHALIDMAPHLGDGWALIGGQMALLYRLGTLAPGPLRETTDVDLIVDIRADPSGLDRIHRVLTAHGFEQLVGVETGLGHRYKHMATEGMFDVLAPEGLGDRTRLELGAARTLSASGGSRALARSEDVQIDFEGRSAIIRIPDIVGATVIKGAALLNSYEHRGRGWKRHAEDLEVLVPQLPHHTKITPPLTKSEKRVFKDLETDTRLLPHVRAKIAQAVFGVRPGGA